MLTFQEALTACEGESKRHLLLGNGFSIACRPDSFRYINLFDEADFSELSIDVAALFALSGTADFERAIDSLRISREVLDLYEERKKLAERIKADSDRLKAALAGVLAENHPDAPHQISDGEYTHARTFLTNFPDTIFTLNYDLLLYWTLMQDHGPEVSSDDGFRQDPEDADAEWVIWDGFANFGQRIYFLHGGLHLYDGGSVLKKITWARTSIPLIDQIRAALQDDVYPYVVTEGSSEEKLRKIEHSPYLHRGLKSLQQVTGSIFLHGHSLHDNDAHVLHRIEQGKVRRLFVSLHGDPESTDNQTIQNRARLMSDRRAALSKNRLEVDFYDADSADVWGSSAPDAR